MAIRPVFTIKEIQPYYNEIATEFVYCSGFSEAQRRRSYINLHNSFLKKHEKANILEVSRFSDSILGQELSAFNLMLKLNDGSRVPVENAFQSSKVFENGKQYSDLLYTTPINAKMDPRLKESGNLKFFSFQDEVFPINPKTFFYDWIYINALNNNSYISDELLRYNAFTDIVFNPEKSINCQARTVAIYVSLKQQGLLNHALRSAAIFKDTVYINNGFCPIQTSLFDIY